MMRALAATMMRAIAALECMLIATAAAADGPPRLAGIVIAPSYRAALFDDGSGVIASSAEGETIGGYIVRSIGSGGVRIERNGQSMLLVPTAADAPLTPIDTGGVTFGLVLRQQPPPDD